MKSVDGMVYNIAHVLYIVTCEHYERCQPLQNVNITLRSIARFARFLIKYVGKHISHPFRPYLVPSTYATAFAFANQSHIPGIRKLVHITKVVLERGIVDSGGFSLFQFDFHEANSGTKGKKEFGRPWLCISG
jgi:hypothetical protein